jgi:hypothetical protein
VDLSIALAPAPGLMHSLPYKETGKPIIFSWTKDNGVGSVLIGRVLDELRDG